MSDPQDGLPSSKEVNAAADRRIRERGPAEFKETVDHMANDPSWAPDPIDLIRAGVPDEGDEDNPDNITLPEDIRDECWPDGGEIR